MATASEAAQRVIDKLVNSEKARTVAVFLKGDDIQMTGLHTELCAEAMRKRFRDLVGVYDRGAVGAWIRDDLNYMGLQG